MRRKGRVYCKVTEIGGKGKGGATKAIHTWVKQSRAAANTQRCEGLKIRNQRIANGTAKRNKRTFDNARRRA